MGKADLLEETSSVYLLPQPGPQFSYPPLLDALLHTLQISDHEKSAEDRRSWEISGRSAVMGNQRGSNQSWSLISPLNHAVLAPLVLQVSHLSVYMGERRSKLNEVDEDRFFAIGICGFLDIGLARCIPTDHSSIVVT